MPGRPHHTEKFRSCVEQVIAKGNSEDSAYAICTTQLQKAGEPIFEGAESRSAEEFDLLRDLNCGTGSGGFQPGNTCGAGDGESMGLAKHESVTTKTVTDDRLKESWQQLSVESKFVMGKGAKRSKELLGKKASLTKKGWVVEEGSKGTSKVTHFKSPKGYSKDKAENEFRSAQVSETILQTLEDTEVRHLHLLGATGLARKIIEAGKNWLVVPVVALMEGVIHAVNASTPEFVPLATLQKAAATWNGKPVTLGHPKRDGKQCSAEAPDILEAHGIGVIKNSRVEGSKLLQEVWIDCERARKLHPEMLARLEANKTEEVSVGAFVVTDGKASNHNGKAYQASWIDAAGDHLAFLPGGRGACSVAMGCGSHRAAAHLVCAEAIETVSDAVLEALETLGTAEPTALRTAIGARNSSKDAKMIQTMHDHAVSLGAQCDRGNYETAEEVKPCSCHKHDDKILEDRPIKFEGGRYVLYSQDGQRKLAEHGSMVEAKAHAQAISLALAQRVAGA
jgi:Uncharacterized protein conserved in bacteria (DUF2213)